MRLHGVPHGTTFCADHCLLDVGGVGPVKPRDTIPSPGLPILSSTHLNLVRLLCLTFFICITVSNILWTMHIYKCCIWLWICHGYLSGSAWSNQEDSPAWDLHLDPGRASSHVHACMKLSYLQKSNLMHVAHLALRMERSYHYFLSLCEGQKRLCSPGLRRRCAAQTSSHAHPIIQIRLRPMAPTI